MKPPFKWLFFACGGIGLLLNLVFIVASFARDAPIETSATDCASRAPISLLGHVPITSPASPNGGVFLFCVGSVSRGCHSAATHTSPALLCVNCHRMLGGIEVACDRRDSRGVFLPRLSPSPMAGFFTPRGLGSVAPG
jgi:hypothetical protein